jgi:hypothetical protein
MEISFINSACYRIWKNLPVAVAYRYFIHVDGGCPLRTTKSISPSLIIGQDRCSAVKFSLTAKATALAGYRALYVDYRKGSGSNRYKVTTQGPVIGMMYEF